MTDTKTWARVKSPWVLHFNSGACNGCDIEIVALLTPKYDVERFGIKLEPSPRHADVLLVTGCVTQQCAERLKRVYDQMPQPKFVVAIGACACSGGVFAGNYNTLRRRRQSYSSYRLHTGLSTTPRSNHRRMRQTSKRNKPAKSKEAKTG